MVGEFVLPTRTAPARSMRSAKRQWKLVTWFASARTPPNVAGQPGLKSNRSLIATGTPCSAAHLTTRANGLVSGRGSLPGVVEALVNEGVEGGIALLYALDGGLEDLRRGEFSATDPATQLCGGHPC